MSKLFYRHGVLTPNLQESSQLQLRQIATKIVQTDNNTTSGDSFDLLLYTHTLEAKDLIELCESIIEIHETLKQNFDSSFQM